MGHVGWDAVEVTFLNHALFIANLQARFSRGPQWQAGHPRYKNSRILVLNLLAQGYEIADVLYAYRELTEADVRVAMALGAKLADYEEIELVDETAAR